MRTIARTAFFMIILTFISKCFGFIREMVMANYFGTSYITDAYVMSFTILSVLFGGVITAISMAYIPIYSKIKENKGKSEGDLFTSSIINLLFLVASLTSVVGIVFSDQIIFVFASGFSGETAMLASFYIKILFSYVLFSSTSGILDAYLQYKGAFLSQIVSGYFVSICTVIAIVISAYTSCYYLAFGMLIGYLLRFIIMIMIAKKNSYKYTPTLRRDDNIKEIVFLAMPTFIGSYTIYINQFIDKTLASRLAEGSIAALNYASLLNNMIIGVTITVLSTIIYPKLSKANSLEQYDFFNRMAGTGLNLVVMISLPCSLGAMVYSRQIIQIVYERGAFDLAATGMTGSAFFYYALGLLFMSVYSLLTRVCYAIHDTKTPMFFACVGVIINIVLNLILIQFMALNGLALATSISSFCNTIMLYIALKKKYPHIVIINSQKTLLKIAAATVLMIAGSVLIYQIIITQLAFIIVARFAQLLLTVLLSATLYLVLLIVLKVEEVKLLKQIIVKR